MQKSVTTAALTGLVNVRRDYFTNNALSGAPASTVYGGNIDDAWFRGIGMPHPEPFSYWVTAALYVPVSGQWTVFFGSLALLFGLAAILSPKGGRFSRRPRNRPPVLLHAT